MTLQSSNTRILLLLAALTFTLSSLPSLGSRRAVTSSDWSSMSSDPCLLETQLQHANTATCTVEKQGHSIAVTVSLNQSDEDVQERDPNDPMQFKSSTKKAVSADIQMETECKTGCLDGKNRDTQHHPDIPVDLKNIGSVISAMVNADTDKMADQVTKDEKVAQDKKNCKKDADGNDIDSSDKEGILRCFSANLATVSDSEKAAYYNKNIKAKLTEAVGSPNASDRQMALDLMNSDLASVGNDSVARSVAQLQRFATFSNNVYKFQLGVLSAQNAQVRQQYQAGLQSYLQRYQAQFTSQGMNVKNIMVAANGSAIPYGDANGMNGDLGPSYGLNDLDAQNAAVVANHAAMTNGSTDPISARGVNRGTSMMAGMNQQMSAPGSMPLTSLGAQQGQQQQQMMMPQPNLQGRSVNPNGFSVVHPVAGQRVN
jgi:hypothetical protein